MAQIEIKGIIGDKPKKDNGKIYYSYSQFLTDFAKAGNEPIDLYIGSLGGNANHGRNIAKFINERQDRFTSVSNIGPVASIAANIFLALSRDKRFFDPSKGVFLIHNPYLGSESLMQGNYTADVLQKIGSELETLESEMASFYSIQTDVNVDVLRGLMEINKPLTEEQIADLNIASVYKYEAVAFLNQTNENNETMNAEDVKKIMQEEKKGFLAEFIDEVKRIFAPKPEPVAVMLTDATGAQVEFPDVEEGNTPQVGDMARMADGSPVPAEVVMADGSTYKFEASKLTEIVPAMEEPEADPNAERIAQLEAELAELKAVKAELTAKEIALLAKDKEVFELKAQIKSQMPDAPVIEAPAEPSNESTFMQAAKKVKAQII